MMAISNVQADMERLLDCYGRTNILPWSGALAGPTYPLDRVMVAKALASVMSPKTAWMAWPIETLPSSWFLPFDYYGSPSRFSEEIILGVLMSFHS
jgi:hypothetical protein